MAGAEGDGWRESGARERPVQLYRRLAAHIAQAPGRLLFIALGLAVSTGALLSIPWLIKELSHDALISRQPHAAYSYLGLILLAATALAVGRFIVDDQIGVVSLRMVGRLRDELTAKLFRLPPAHFVHGRGGEAVSTVFNDVRQLQTFLNDSVVMPAADLLTAVGAIIFLFVLSWKLALIMLAIAAIAVVVVGTTSRVIRRAFGRMQGYLAVMTAFLAERVAAMPAIHAFGAAEYEQRAFAERGAEYVRVAVRANRVHAGARALMGLIGAAAFVSVFALGTSAVMAGAGIPGASSGLTFDRLAGFAMYALLTADPLRRLSRTNLLVQEALAAGRRVFDLLDMPEERRAGRRLLPPDALGRLQFESVGFLYHPGEPVLTDIDLSIEPGEIVAIAGPSGAGKSTLVHLLLGFHEPTSGRVLFDGHDIRGLDLAELRRRIGWVGHDPFLFDASIAENIRYGSWTADRAAIELAARRAGADVFIRDLPDGYDTRIGERGAALSAGQRMRIAVARVVLRSPQVVILDEVTASLDTETETRLWMELEDWTTQRTLLVIAHRFSTVLNSPRVIVLEGGRKVGDGPPEWLARTCPTFLRIFREQMGAGATH